MARTDRLGVPEIIAGTHEVTVCGVSIKRPDSIAPSQWLDFWKEVNTLREE